MNPETTTFMITMAHAGALDVALALGTQTVWLDTSDTFDSFDADERNRSC